MPQIVEIEQSQGVWLHADCTYGGVLAIVPGYRSLFIGLEAIDSWVVNPHK